MYSNIYIYIHIIFMEKNTDWAISELLLETVDRGLHAWEIAPQAPMRQMRWFLLGSEKPNQHQPKISKDDFQMFPPISTNWAFLSIFTAPFRLLFCVLCVILCVWQWIEKNQRIRAARVVPSGLAPLVMSWDRRKPHVILMGNQHHRNQH